MMITNKDIGFVVIITGISAGLFCILMGCPAIFVASTTPFVILFGYIFASGVLPDDPKNEGEC